jgi:hypothetical protein
MERNTVIEKLRTLDPDDVVELDSCAEQVVTDSREAARSAVTLWAGSDEALKEKARYLLVNVEDIAIVPLLEAPNHPEADERAWLIRTVADAVADLRRRAASKLKAILDDETIVPGADDEDSTEEPAPLHRVCDEAYLAMRQLLHLDETEREFNANASAFSALTFEERDTHIQSARQSRAWTNLIDDEEWDEEEE